MSKKLYPLLPLGIIALSILIIYLTGANHLVSFDALQQGHSKLRAFVDAHPLLAVLYFVGIYTVSVVLVLPDSAFLSVLAGFSLFPSPLRSPMSSLRRRSAAPSFTRPQNSPVANPWGERRKLCFTGSIKNCRRIRSGICSSYASPTFFPIGPSTWAPGSFT